MNRTSCGVNDVLAARCKCKRESPQNDHNRRVWRSAGVGATWFIDCGGNGRRAATPVRFHSKNHNLDLFSWNSPGECKPGGAADAAADVQDAARLFGPRPVEHLVDEVDLGLNELPVGVIAALPQLRAGGGA